MAETASQSGQHKCMGCNGTGMVRQSRVYQSLATGEASTMIGLTRCPHCRSDPGRQRHPGPPM